MYPLSSIPRFANTPTVVEVYESEHKEPNLAVERETKEELSKEYNRVDGVNGTEGYYQLLFNELPYDIEEVEGNESFVGWVAKGVNALIERVKTFFKWVFNYFVGNDRVKDDNIEEAEQQLKMKSVKEGNIPYLAGSRIAFGKTGPLPNNIQWVGGSIKNLDAKIIKGNSYISLVKELFKKIESSKPETYEDILKDHAKKVTNLFSGDLAEVSFVGNKKLKVDGNGKLLFVINPVVNDRKGQKDPSFTTNRLEIETYLNQLSKTLEHKGAYQKELLTIETTLVNNLRKFLSLKETDSNPETRRAVELVKRSVGNILVSVNGLTSVFNATFDPIFSLLNHSIKG